jgi:hypothetical protein
MQSRERRGGTGALLSVAAAADQADRTKWLEGTMSAEELRSRDAARARLFRRWLRSRQLQEGLDHAEAEAVWLLSMHLTRPGEIGLAFSMLAAAEAPDRQALAFLCDRMLLLRGLPQVFGTQVRVRTGTVKLADVFDPTRMPELRMHLGLEPVDEYVEHLQRRYARHSVSNDSAS